MTSTLYAIEDHLVALFDTLEGMDADTPKELRAGLEEEIQRAVGLELAKVDGVCRMLAHFESQAELAGAEIKRLQARKKTVEFALERLEGHVLLAMKLASKTIIEGATSTLKVQANPASVVIVDEALVPAGYKTLIPESWQIRKADVGKALKAGLRVPGAVLDDSNVRLVRK